MKYNIIATEKFQNDIRYYAKKKKFTHIISDVDQITDELENGNLIGDVIPGLKLDESNTFKVRMANSDTHVGKSNGYRLIYYVVKNDQDIYLLTIYYKKEDNRIPTNTEIEQLVKEYCM